MKTTRTCFRCETPLVPDGYPEDLLRCPACNRKYRPVRLDGALAVMQVHRPDLAAATPFPAMPKPNQEGEP